MAQLWGFIAGFFDGSRVKKVAIQDALRNMTLYPVRKNGAKKAT